jgi:hypothetical protein
VRAAAAVAALPLTLGALSRHERRSLLGASAAAAAASLMKTAERHVLSAGGWLELGCGSEVCKVCKELSLAWSCQVGSLLALHYLAVAPLWQCRTRQLCTGHTEGRCGGMTWRAWRCCFLAVVHLRRLVASQCCYVVTGCWCVIRHECLYEGPCVVGLMSCDGQPAAALRWLTAVQQRMASEWPLSCDLFFSG